MHHPVASRCPRAFLDRIDVLVDEQRIEKRDLPDEYILYKCVETRHAAEEARFAQGLLVRNRVMLNLPFPKFDEFVTFVPDMTEYHRRIMEAMPAPCAVQPLHDGACIYAVRHDGLLLVHTFFSMNNNQVEFARRILNERVWKDRVTLAFELVCSEDPKVQQQRTEGLHLLYGADATTGCELTRAELEAVSKQLEVPLVKQQLIKKKTKVMDLLRSIDDVDTIKNVRKGLVLIDEDGHRHKIKSHNYHRLAGLPAVPTQTWFATTVQLCRTLDELHETVEIVDGPIDTALVARLLLLDLIRDGLKRLDSVRSNHVVDRVDEAIRGALLHDPRVYDDDDGVLKLFKLIAWSSVATP